MPKLDRPADSYAGYGANSVGPDRYTPNLALSQNKGVKAPNIAASKTKR
jgi:hypothetical protein